MTLTIDRQIWLRGEGSQSELFRRRDCKRCFVGILLSVLGVPDRALIDKTDASDVQRLPTNARWVVTVDDSPEATALKIYRTNDNEKISDTVREARLTALAGSKGITVQFTGAIR